jgi:VWFA-related protein
MLFEPRLGVLLFASLLCTASSPAQQSSAGSAPPAPNFVYLDVVVTPKSGGAPLTGLQQQDFTITDNKSPATINSFLAVDGRQTPFEIVLVIDDVNTNITQVAYERSEIDKFLHTDGGHLVNPMALAFLTDSGLEMQQSFSTDGAALSAALDQHEIGLHSIRRSGGIYSAVERFDLSLKAFLQLVNFEGPRPGRKFIIWISPGWPLLSGPGVEEQITEKQRDQIYGDVVRISTIMRQGRVTLYSIDPLGTADFGGRSFRWEAYQKGISKPNQADAGDLALQVLAVQSGGLALTTGNDLAAFLHRCVQDTSAYYEFSIAPPLDQKPNTYHQVEVRVDKPGTVARTRTGYYSQ